MHNPNIWEAFDLLVTSSEIPFGNMKTALVADHQ